MAVVKWIKLATNIFDNRKIRQIEGLPDGDAIIVIWVKLLCLAGNINDAGYVYFTKEIPYTDQMLATQFNRPLTTVQLALKTFEQFGMVEVIDNILHISNWEKYQNIEGLDKIREQNRLRKAAQRARQRELPPVSRDSHGTVTQGHATDKEEDIDRDIEEKEEDTKSVKENTRTLFDRLRSEYILSDPLTEKMREWITYKMGRRESYQEVGMKALLRKVENNSLAYGEQAVCELIDDSMANGWKGIMFDRLKQKPVQKGGYQKQTKAEELDDFYRMASNWSESK